MSRLAPLAALILAVSGLHDLGAEERPMFSIAIHGGAGTLSRAEMTPQREAAYRAGLAAALDAGYAVLEQGGTSLDAVVTAVRILEDDPHFNAGRGAVLTYEGDVELDASIMDGATGGAGAVAGLRHIRNPIDLARAVMEKSPHVMLIGAGAEEYALTLGMPLVPNDWFKTDVRREQLRKVLMGDRGPTNELSALGTVGAVARDRAGNLAAATSTGGMTAKRYGRVGDSPIIGAGTWADNASCAISATGHGEYFIRAAVAHDICARVAYRGIPLSQAADEVVMQRLVKMGGEGGIIGVDAQGRIVMTFNSEGMFRGARSADGHREVEIFR